MLFQTKMTLWLDQGSEKASKRHRSTCIVPRSCPTKVKPSSRYVWWIQTWSPKNSANAAFACWTASLLRTKPGPPIGMSSLPFSSSWWQRNSGWGRGSNSTFKTGMGSTRPPGLHNRFIAPTLTWQWLFPARCPKLGNTCEMEKAHGQSATKKGSFLEMCVLLASNCFHQFPFPCWTPGQSGIRLLIMWFRTLANHVTKNCTLTHCASNPLVCHQTPPSQLKLAQTCQAQQCQSYRIPKKLASTKVTHKVLHQISHVCCLHVAVQTWTLLMFDF